MEVKIIDEKGGLVAICEHTKLAVFWDRTRDVYKDVKLSISPDDQAALDKIAAESNRKSRQLAGIEFQAVMCSATAEDQNGLSALLLKHALAKMTAQQLPDIHFRFENGNVLTLNSTNIEAFDAVWTPYRLSFFPPAEVQPDATLAP